MGVETTASASAFFSPCAACRLGTGSTLLRSSAARPWPNVREPTSEKWRPSASQSSAAAALTSSAVSTHVSGKGAEEAMRRRNASTSNDESGGGFGSALPSAVGAGGSRLALRGVARDFGWKWALKARPHSKMMVNLGQVLRKNEMHTLILLLFSSTP